MKAWGMFIPHLEALSPRLRDCADAINDVLAANPGAAIDMTGEMRGAANELRALANLISAASRKHAQAPTKGR